MRGRMVLGLGIGGLPAKRHWVQTPIADIGGQTQYTFRLPVEVIEQDA